ncbi:MAG TPA: glycerophosphodiester phosphodiesterase family protein [Candidatus Hydrogenedentes bacterium]|nr:glycerophosphodiester phosphodiesterase family protein [Candidatus Hydrogenedentota bacterium]HPC16337.1 glycerophosphodiester phosphodiesterase family protein [Candidatus Hydrogenedentota bacterium]HRT20745.1 glycerophosphodiester phosphodiesterase family protein [Candidatus Hydrogenedentota bacterium]HRT66747.1 glycerophosphodiester phosphodiesterase family protein [Candidatus Hydrogenedentota bacterium]
MLVATALWGLCLLAAGENDAPVQFQAHRGGLKEAPENTMAAYRHAWTIPGAIPEVDVTVAQDGTMVCIHDDTPGRTTNAPAVFRTKRIGEIPIETLRSWDAGAWFDARFAGEKVPLLTEVFEEMKGRPERQVYLDLKNVSLAKLAALIADYGLRNQIIFVHGDPEMCKGLHVLFPGARTMTWISGKPERIQQRFAELAQTNFAGISQLQFHLPTLRTEPEIEYALDEAFLREAIAKTRAAGVELQLRPFDFDARALGKLVKLGVRWFVADEPRRFAEALENAK